LPGRNDRVYGNKTDFVCITYSFLYFQEDPPYIKSSANSNEKEVPIIPLPPRPKNSIFEDEERSRLLQKLLQSKNPDDLQAANRLIKTMVKEVRSSALQKLTMFNNHA
jgi:hypothetical protein